MGFFDRLKKRQAGPSMDSIEAEAGDKAVCAPVSGRLVSMSDVPDAVFSAGILGPGCAIWPESDDIYAPVCGEVTVAMGHAFGIACESGIEVLVHCGLDTVEMQGDGFTGFVKEGDRVCAGQPLMRMDRAAIADAGHSDCVVLVVSNMANYSAVDMALNPEQSVRAGQKVLNLI